MAKDRESKVIFRLVVLLLIVTVINTLILWSNLQGVERVHQVVEQMPETQQTAQVRLTVGDENMAVEEGPAEAEVRVFVVDEPKEE